jgi:hypothetical protein
MMHDPFGDSLRSQLRATRATRATPAKKRGTAGHLAGDPAVAPEAWRRGSIGNTPPLGRVDCCPAAQAGQRTGGSRTDGKPKRDETFHCRCPGCPGDPTKKEVRRAERSTVTRRTSAVFAGAGRVCGAADRAPHGLAVRSMGEPRARSCSCGSACFFDLPGAEGSASEIASLPVQSSALAVSEWGAVRRNAGSEDEGASILPPVS